MKILVVCPIYAPSFASGGVTRVAFDTATALAARGHDVTVYTSDVLGDVTRPPAQRRHRARAWPEVVEGVPVHYFRYWFPRLRWKTGFTFTPGMSWVARRAAESAQVIFIHEVRTYQAVVMARAARRAEVPYVLMPHGALPQETGRSRFKRIFDRFFTRALLRHASAVVALNREEAQLLLNSGVQNDRIEVIPNAVRVPSELASREAVRERLGIADDETAILFLGRLHKRKGADLLVRAVRELRDRNLPVRLMIAGADDGHGAELTDLVRELDLGAHVAFLGSVSEREKEEYYAAADLFALTSYGEGQPMTLLEACAHGLPVVVTRGTNFHQVNEGIGLMVEADAESIADAVEELIRDPHRRAIMGRAALTLVREHHSLDRQVGQMESLFRKVAR